MSVELLAPGVMTGLNQVLLMLYNFACSSNALWVSDQEISKKPIVMKGLVYFFNVLHHKEVKEMLNESRHLRETVLHIIVWRVVTVS